MWTTTGRTASTRLDRGTGAVNVNRRRLADLFRQQAELSQEIAAALLEDEPANDPVPKPRRARSPRIVPPAVEPSELDRARARRELADLGYRRGR
jgi:hypothetical protein